MEYLKIMSVSKLVTFNEQDGALWDNIIFFSVIFDFDGVLLHEQGQIAWLHLKGQIFGFTLLGVPRFVAFHVGQSVSRTAFQDVARLDIFLLLIASRKI